MTLPPDYVVPVDKPAGPTSHDVVATARRALGTRRIGHTGTLDPFASGLLLLCVGKATRLAEYLSGEDKSYEAVARLGVATDTLDLQGEVVSESDGWTSLGASDVSEALEAFRGTIAQTPPQFSAKKVGGEAMHRRARRGERVELEPCAVTVHEIELRELRLPEVHLHIRCSSGTYIRSIARDLGDALGVGAHLTALRRTAIGSVGVEAAIPPEALADPTSLGRARVELLQALPRLPNVHVDADEAARLGHGQSVRAPEGDPEGVVAVARGDRLLAIGEIRDGLLRPRKVFTS